VILDATSTTDDKTKSRWSRALRYAWRERRTWTDLKRFLRENGRARRAEKFAAINPREKYPGLHRLPLPRNRSTVFDSPKGTLMGSTTVPVQAL
jgi:hypothetical protein